MISLKHLDSMDAAGEDLFSLESQEGKKDPFEGDIFSYPETDRSERWSVSWADLMMTMFIVFLTLYVYQARNQVVKIEAGSGGNYISDTGPRRAVNLNTRTQALVDIYKEFQQTLKKDFADDMARVDLITDRAVRFSLAGDILFDPGQAKLKPQARRRLRQIAGFLHGNNVAVNVAGHTDDVVDNTGQYPTNWELSTARACAVARYLMEEQGVEEHRFFVSGHSQQRPLVPNSSDRNRALNRRVEIILMNEIPQAKGWSSEQ